MVQLGHEAFVASDDIWAGALWGDAIDKALAGAERSIVLCSRWSVDRAWLWMEFGAARARGLDPIPLLLPEMRPRVILKQERTKSFANAASFRWRRQLLRTLVATARPGGVSGSGCSTKACIPIARRWHA